MIVQWCIKGLRLNDDDAARSIIDSRSGISCNWFRNFGPISTVDIRQKLTEANLNLHVNHFGSVDPATGLPFSAVTPFISMSAGSVERDAVMKTNRVHGARETALWFGTGFGASDVAYLFLCWVVIPPRAAVEIEGLAEEVRDLNTYRSYSAFQPEGEVAAKVWIPDNQMQGCEKWHWDRPNRRLIKEWWYANPRFTPPERLTNVRELF